METNTAKLIESLNAQCAAKGLLPLCAEQLAVLATPDSQECQDMLADLRDRCGLDAELSAKAHGASVDLSGIRNAASVYEVALVGGRLLLAAGSDAEISAIQLAMRARVSSL